jgi:hypothetical protein
MSEYSRFIAWDRSCSDRPGYGMTSGDTMHLGLRDYNEQYPCPNGLPVQTGGPQQSEAWRKRVEKAKAFIEQWNSEQRVVLLAESISIDDVKKGIEVLRTWANSLRQR